MNLGLTRAVTWVTRRSTLLGFEIMRSRRSPGHRRARKAGAILLLALNVIACGDTTAADGPIGVPDGGGGSGGGAGNGGRGGSSGSMGSGGVGGSDGSGGSGGTSGSGGTGGSAGSSGAGTGGGVDASSRPDAESDSSDATSDSVVSDAPACDSDGGCAVLRCCYQDRCIRSGDPCGAGNVCFFGLPSSGSCQPCGHSGQPCCSLNNCVDGSRCTATPQGARCGN
jgi:hypothetical protein